MAAAEPNADEVLRAALEVARRGAGDPRAYAFAAPPALPDGRCAPTPETTNFKYEKSEELNPRWGGGRLARGGASAARLAPTRPSSRR